MFFTWMLDGLRFGAKELLGGTVGLVKWDGLREHWSVGDPRCVIDGACGELGVLIVGSAAKLQQISPMCHLFR